MPSAPAGSKEEYLCRNDRTQIHMSSLQHAIRLERTHTSCHTHLACNVSERSWSYLQRRQCTYAASNMSCTMTRLMLVAAVLVMVSGLAAAAGRGLHQDAQQTASCNGPNTLGQACIDLNNNQVRMAAGLRDHDQIQVQLEVQSAPGCHKTCCIS